MKILEVSAIPPVVYSRTAGEGTTIPDWIRGSIGWARNGFKENQSTILMTDPIARKSPFTQLTIYDLAGNAHQQTLGTTWFLEDKQTSGRNTDYEVTVQGVTLKGDLLSDLTACNMQNNALNYWEVPDTYIDADRNGTYSPITDTVGGYLRARSVTTNGSISYTPPTFIYNNKARYFQSVRIRAYSPTSGESLEKNIYDILPQSALPGVTSYNLAFAVGADIRPQGCPLFCWTYNDGGTDQRTSLTEYIKGGKWVQLALTNTGLPGSYFEMLSNRNQSADRLIGSAVALGGGLLTAGIGGATIGAASKTLEVLGNSEWIENKDTMMAPYRQDIAMGNKMVSAGRLGAIAGIGGFASSLIKASDQDHLLARRGVCAATPAFTNNSDFAKDTLNNGFKYIITRYNDQDMIDYDAFLEKFGYNVGNMIIGTQHFYSRENFVFIRVNDITITSNKVGRQLLDKVAIQLKAGVRIWRHKVSIAAMNPGGNNTPNPAPYGG